jgi:heme exporter protein A
LSKRYGSRTVFRDVNFAVPHGSVAAIVGSNGAGKSTLLKILAGLVRPSQGAVEWRVPREEYSRAGLFAPDAPVYRELTVRENLEFFARPLPPSTPLDEHIARFALDARRDQAAGDLSSGWRARLQLAVATLGAPSLLLLDEPSAHLDAAGLDLLHGVLEAQRAHGVALVATNDPREAQRCDFSIEL